MEFRKIEIGDKKYISDLMRSTDCQISEFDFVTSFLWSNKDQYFMAEENGVLYLRNKYGTKYLFAPPIAPRNVDLTEGLVKIQNYCKQNDIPFLVRAFGSDMIDRIDRSFLETISVKYDRDSAEYVYKVRDLIELNATKSLRDKFNRIVKFESSYNYSFREYNKTDFESIFILFDEWNKNTIHETTMRERQAIETALNNYSELGIRCGVIEIDDKIVAFSIGSQMYSGQAQVLFEKADTSYYGIYQAINKYYLEHFYSDCEYVNRQEDLGIEGLRRAKMSYNPAFLVEKYRLESRD